MILQARWPHDYDTNNPLHHDMNRAARRVATVIMYLADAEGGHTLFPCLRPVALPNVGTGACNELVRGFENDGLREVPARIRQVPHHTSSTMTTQGPGGTPVTLDSLVASRHAGNLFDLGTVGGPDGF